MARTKTTERKRVNPADRPFFCHHCGTRFLRKTYLNVHIKKFHSTGINSEQEKSVTLMPEKVETEMLSYSDEDWTDPDISLEEPLRESEGSSELEDNNDKKDYDSVESDLIVSESDSEVVQKEEEDEKAEGQSEIQTEEAEKADRSSEVQKEEEDEKTECSNLIQKEKVAGVREKDKREIRDIYQGRLYSKRTVPMRVMAPKRQSTCVLPEKDEDIDEIELKLKDSRKKRLVLKCPCGKRLKLDIQLE